MSRKRKPGHISRHDQASFPLENHSQADFEKDGTQKREFRIEAPKILVQEIEKLMTFQTLWMFPNPNTNHPYSDLRKPIQTAVQ